MKEKLIVKKNNLHYNFYLVNVQKTIDDTPIVFFVLTWQIQMVDLF